MRGLFNMWNYGLLRLVVVCAGLLAGTPLQAGLPDIVERIKPAVVGVGTYQATRRMQLSLQGTGFVVLDGRHVVTNYHVVSRKINQAEGERYVIMTAEGQRSRWRAVRIAAHDEQHDLAVLAFDGLVLPTMKVNSDKRVREGERVAFTGFPIISVLGLYPVTHQGIVSAITPMIAPMNQDRDLSAYHIKQLRDAKPHNVYQLDAIAYPGNSGSPVYDTASGDVLGVINSVIVKRNRESVLEHPSGISYAIPAVHVAKLLRRIRSE